MSQQKLWGSRSRGEDPRCMAGGIEAERKGIVIISVGDPTFSLTGDQRIHFPKLPWLLSVLGTTFYGLSEACPQGPYCLVYPYNKPLISEVTWGSLFLSTKSLIYRKMIGRQSGGGGARVTLEEVELAGPDGTRVDRTFKAGTTAWLRGMCEERKRMGGEVTKVE